MIGSNKVDTAKVDREMVHNLVNDSKKGGAKWFAIVRDYIS